MKLTDEEKNVLMGKRQVKLALESWQELLKYLMSLVEADSQHYTDTTVRKRLKLSKKSPIKIEMETGEIDVVSTNKTATKV